MKICKVWIRFYSISFAILNLLTVFAFAQTGNSGITGTVFDTQGAAIAGAQIVATNTGTGLRRSVTSAENGTYVVPRLPVGIYSLAVSQAGFGAFSQTGIVLTADQLATVNVTLQVGSAQQTVNVSANAEMLETATPELGQTVNQTSVVNLPLNGRNPAGLVLLTPGAVNGVALGPIVNQTNVSNPNDTGASINGGRQGSVFYLLDGAPNMDSGNLLGNPFPNADATEEFRVISNNFSAQYGFAPSAVVSIVSKGGTNSWHGTAFEFLRSHDFNASNWFSHQTDKLTRNQFGGGLGGPLIHNKLFIFGNYQRTPESNSTSGTSAFVPNNKMRAGDFSDLLAGKTTNLCGTGGPSNLDFDRGQIFVPSRGTAFVCPPGSAQAGTTVFIKQPVSGNNINSVPGLALDSVAMGVLSTYPRTTATNGQILLPGFSRHDVTDEYTIRGDYAINDKQRITGRVFYQHFNLSPFTGNGNLLETTSSWSTPFISYSGNWTWTIRPNLLNTFIVGWSRHIDNSFPAELVDGKPVSWATYGAKINYPTEYVQNIESASITGWSIYSGNSNVQRRHALSFTDSLDWTKGKHMVIVGADVLRYDWWDATDYDASPVIQFNGQTTGQSISDFMLGYIDNFTQGGGVDDKSKSWNIAPYIQEAYRVKPNLTLNVGLRWEPYLPATFRGDRAVAFRPGQQSTRYPNAPAGLVYPGDSGVNKNGGIATDWLSFSPRIGLAWQPRWLHGTSIRAAFGIFNAPIQNNYFQHNSMTAPFCSVINFGYPNVSGLIRLADPWASYAPSGYTSPFPPFCFGGNNPSQNVQFLTPVSITNTFARKFSLGKDQTWNVSVQQELSQNLILQIAYVGSQTYHLPIQLQANPYVNNTLNPLRIYPQFSTVQEVASWATASYHALQLSLNKRLSRGLQLTSNYTWSKGIDTATQADVAFSNPVGSEAAAGPGSWRNNRGISSLDIPHNWNTYLIWQAPTLQQSKQLVRQLMGGWQISAIVSVHSGTPFTLSGGCTGDQSHTGIGNERADTVPGQMLDLKQGSDLHWVNRYFNPNAFTCAAPGSFGNTSRNFLSGPGFYNWDTGLGKSFPLGEKYRAQFRWELFNALNHPNFGLPGSTPGTGAFGKITSLANSSAPRVMQFGFKFDF